VDHIALLTPRQVIPAAIVEYLEGLYGRDGVVDAQELYYRVKYEKSEVEMRPLFFFGAIPDLPIRYFLPARIHSRLLRQQESDAPHDSESARISKRPLARSSAVGCREIAVSSDHLVVAHFAGARLSSWDWI
jgi:hypothetical protein